MSTFIQDQLIVSTADEERNYHAVMEQKVFPEPPSVSPGLYRIIDGQLYRVIPAPKNILTPVTKD